MIKTLNEGLTPADFTSKSAEMFDVNALTEKSRQAAEGILSKIEKGTLQEHEIEDTDLDPATRAFLHLVNKDKDFDIQSLLEEYHNELAWELLRYDPSLLTDNLWNLENLDKGIALELIERGNFDDICTSLNCFKEEDHYDILLTVLKTDEPEEAINYLGEIEGLDYFALFDALLSEGSKYEHTVHSIVKYSASETEDFDYNRYVLKMLEKSNDPYYLSEDMDKFKGLNREVFNKLVDIYPQAVAYELGNHGVFKREELEVEDYNRLALKLLNDGGSEGAYNLSEDLGSFSSLSEEVARKLIEEGYSHKIGGNSESFDTSVDTKALIKEKIDRDEEEGKKMWEAKMKQGR